MHSNIKIIGLGGMGANALLSMKKASVVANTLVVDTHAEDVTKSQLKVYEPGNSLDFNQIGTADMMVIITSLAGNVFTLFKDQLIEFATKNCKDVIFIGVMPFDFESLSERANENYSAIKKYKIKRHILRNQQLMDDAEYEDISIKTAFGLVNDTIIELIKKEIIT